MFYPIHEPATDTLPRTPHRAGALCTEYALFFFLMDIPVSKKNVCSFLLQEKSNKGEMSLKEAIDDSENLTDFLMDFEEEE